MSYNTIEKTTIKGIIEWYVNQNIPSYNITERLKFVKGAYSGSDMEEGIECLTKDLNSLGKDGNYINQNNYELQLFPVANAKSKKIPLVHAIKFNFSGEASPGTITGMPVMYNNNALTEDRLLKILEERDRIKELEDIDEEIEEAEPESFMSGIGRELLSDPNIRASIAAAALKLPSILSGIFQQPKVTALAGIKIDKNIDSILKVLFSKGVKIEHLEKLSQMEESKIQMLLTML